MQQKAFYFIIIFIAIFSFGFDNINFAKAVYNKALKSGLQSMPTDSKMQNLQALALGDSNSKYQIDLGKMLYFDPNLSTDNTKSCNTCHNLSTAGSSANDNYHLNAPSIYNVLFNNALNYDGKFSALKQNKESSGDNSKQIGILLEAISNAFTSPGEMNAEMRDIVSYVRNNENYQILFKQAYGSDTINAKLIAKALGAFIVTLNTPTRLDDFLSGNLKAMSDLEIEGLNVFLQKGCVSCHNGINLGGLMQPFNATATYKFSDVGVIMKGDELGNIKVPTLRNINSSMPYFHNGAIKKIDEAIEEMGRVQLGIKLKKKEITAIKAFFTALDGTYPTIVLPNIIRQQN